MPVILPCSRAVESCSHVLIRMRIIPCALWAPVREGAQIEVAAVLDVHAPLPVLAGVIDLDVEIVKSARGIVVAVASYARDSEAMVIYGRALDNYRE